MDKDKMDQISMLILTITLMLRSNKISTLISRILLKNVTDRNMSKQVDSQDKTMNHKD